MRTMHFRLVHYNVIFGENSPGKKLKQHTNIKLLTLTMPTFTFAVDDKE